MPQPLASARSDKLPHAYPTARSARTLRTPAARSTRHCFLSSITGGRAPGAPNADAIGCYPSEDPGGALVLWRIETGDRALCGAPA
jgi:hypothetical protein